ncbi:HIT family protein [uncultured Sphingomonas sp.]|uniref:HIT family protein n=1 Tax=uncultured Sphingomonas sp. TaxID=158754 RepID=UPI0035CA78DD
MPQTLKEFRDKFRIEENLLHRTDGWTVSLRPGACTLGACVISADRPHGSLAGIDAREAAALVAAVSWFETRARATFGADKFNYLALMMVDDQLHLHALPRYASPRDLGGVSWTDPGWPGQPDLKHANTADAQALAAVMAALTGRPGAWR